MDPRFENLRDRADRVFGQEPVEATVERVRAIVGPVRFGQPGAPESDLTRLANAGLATLRDGQPPTPAQFAALQILIRLARPSILSRRGALDPYPTAPNAQSPLDAERVARWEVFRAAARPLLFSVGRIDVHGKRFGTGFLAAPGLLLTNRHVLDQISFGTRLLEPRQAEVHFGQEADTVDTRDPVPVLSAVAWHESLDLALLEVPDDLDEPVLELAAENPAAGDEVVALGYPMEDALNSPEMMERIFAGRFGIKRAAPGELMELGGDVVFHDCSTLGGSSGSPLLSIDEARVLGVHSNGFFAWRNEGVAAAAVRAFVAAHA